MNTYRKLTSLILLCVLAFSITSLYYLKSTYAQAFRGLIIDEYIIELDDVQPGDSIRRSFTIIHDYEDKGQVVLNLRAYNFISDNITGTPKFLLNEELPASADLASWIEFQEDQIVLSEYGDEAEIFFTINVPEDAEPGGKYAAIFPLDLGGDRAIQDAIASAPQVGINGAPGPLVLLNVDGDQSVNIFTEDLFTSNIKESKTKFFFNTPVNITALLKNNGNVYAKPRGAVYIYTGDTIVDPIATLELNGTSSYILGNSTRQFSTTWNDSFIRTEIKVDENGEPILNEAGEFQYKTVYDWDNLSKLRIGKYNVKLMYFFTDADGNQITREANTYIIIFPWQLLVLIVVLVILILLFIISKVIKRKKRSNVRKNDSDRQFVDKFENKERVSLGRILQG